MYGSNPPQKCSSLAVVIKRFAYPAYLDYDNIDQCVHLCRTNIVHTLPILYHTQQVFEGACHSTCELASFLLYFHDIDHLHFKHGQTKGKWVELNRFIVGYHEKRTKCDIMLCLGRYREKK